MNYFKELIKRIKCKVNSCCGCKSNCSLNDDIIEDAEKTIQVVKDIYN